MAERCLTASATRAIEAGWSRPRVAGYVRPRDTFAGVRWLPEGHLPPPTSEKQGQQKLREQYVAHLAGNEVGPTLDRLREHFDAALAAERT